MIPGGRERDVLVAWKLDALSRSLKEWLRDFEPFDRCHQQINHYAADLLAPPSLHLKQPLFVATL